MPDTYTSQFSGEEIDAALRAAQIISGASTPAELRKKLEIRGDTIPVSAEDPTPISGAVKYRTNPNLLDNWFFGNPVNQRGQMEYTGNGYTIDRWSSGVALSLKNGFIRITSSGMYTQIFQTLESDFAGKTFTFSLIVRGTPGAQCRTLAYDYAKDVAYGMGTTHEFVSDGFEMVTVSDTFPSNTPAKLTFILYPDNADTNLSVDILAAKLELGSTQTLAHKEGDRWILNEIPDFGEQLRSCQRYAVELNRTNEEYPMLGIGQARTSTQVSAIVNIPPMRARPTLTTDASKWTLCNGETYITPSSINVNSISNNCMQLFINASGLIQGAVYEVYLHGYGKAFLSADL